MLCDCVTIGDRDKKNNQQWKKIDSELKKNKNEINMNVAELFALAERLRLRGEQAIAFINDTRNSARAERLAEREEAERARQEAERAREEAERQRQHELAMVE